MPGELAIALLTNAPGSQFAQNLALLYPERVTVLDVGTQRCSAEDLAGFTHVVTMITHRNALDELDYGAVRQFAESGRTVVSCLAEYAGSQGLQVTKSVVPDGSIEPAIRIRAVSDITRGFAVGDVTPWYGKVSGATYNECNPNQYYQRQILGLSASDSLTVLAVSTLNAGAVMIEERVGEGRIIAMDLLSLKEPFYNCFGGTNKYLFLGNAIGRTVRYGRHYPAKLPYDDLRKEMQAVADRLPGVTFGDEGPCSDGRHIASLSLGNPDKPRFLFFSGIHGWEWEAGYGLLHLVELLAAENPPEGLSADAFYVKVIPQLNPYGYDHDYRHNANGVDLNRNFPTGWENVVGGDDVYQPWDFDYKGPAPGSEPETQLAMQLIDDLQPTCVLDFHTAHFIFCKPHQGDEALMDAIHGDIKRRWRDRYLLQRPYSTEYQQANMEAATTWREPTGGLLFQGAAMGVPASILIEMSGNRTRTQALIMNTDLTIEVCLAAMGACLELFGG